MQQTKPLSFYFCVLLVIVAFAATLAAALSTALPIGADYYYHLTLSTYLSKGDVLGCWNYNLATIQFPYALYLFHFMLAPSVWTGNPYLVAKILQVLFLPATLALTMRLVYKFGSPKAAVYSGMTLLGSWAFFDGALQVRPESLDLLFYPLMVGAVMAAGRWRFVGLAVATVYSHGVAALSNVYGLAASKLKNKSWRVPLAVGVAAIVPVFVLSVWFVGGAWSHWGGVPPSENPQEYLFWADPVGFIPYYMGATILGVVFVVKAVRERCLSEFQKVTLYGLLGVTVMLPLWADRYLHYVSLPLAVFAGLGVDGLKGKWKLIAVLALVDIVIVYVASYFSFSFGLGGRWWQPGD